MAMALGALLVPGVASADHGGPNQNCEYASDEEHYSGDLDPDASRTVVVYADTDGDGGSSGTADKSAGACADFNGSVFVGSNRFDGGTVEAGKKGVKKGTTDPQVYGVVDGDDQNSDPQGQSDGYFGVSNYETGGSRVTGGPTCNPDTGAAGSSNSGGCLGVDNGPWVYVPGNVPTPVCGNSSGNAWDGSGSSGPHNRDGCSIP